MTTATLQITAMAQDHSHDHHHPPYPHADHPLGPTTLKRNNGIPKD